MPRLFTIAAVTLMLSAPFATAQTIVLGSGLGKECYEAAKFGKSAVRAENICTRALTEQTMTITNRAATFTNRGIVRMRAGKLDEALSDYATSKRMKPDVGATYLNEGAARILQGDYNTALDVLNTAIELDSEDLYAAYYNRAIARENTGDVKGAYFDFKKASELNPEFEKAQLQLRRFTVTQG